VCAFLFLFLFYAVALYLDEPTSGLDSTAALEVTDSLKQIAHATGITVAMVIHQPRYEIWAALDEVLFLAPGGRTVFLGNLKEVHKYFQDTLNMVPTERDNPAGGAKCVCDKRVGWLVG
jgi:ABC-type multidrug transport system ATPase subunit